MAQISSGATIIASIGSGKQLDYFRKFYLIYFFLQKENWLNTANTRENYKRIKIYHENTINVTQIIFAMKIQEEQVSLKWYYSIFSLTVHSTVHDSTYVCAYTCSYEELVNWFDACAASTFNMLVCWSEANMMHVQGQHFVYCYAGGKPIWIIRPGKNRLPAVIITSISLIYLHIFPIKKTFYFARNMLLKIHDTSCLLKQPNYSLN